MFSAHIWRAPRKDVCWQPAAVTHNFSAICTAFQIRAGGILSSDATFYLSIKDLPTFQQKHHNGNKLVPQQNNWSSLNFSSTLNTEQNYENAFQ